MRLGHGPLRLLLLGGRLRFARRSRGRSSGGSGGAAALAALARLGCAGQPGGLREARLLVLSERGGLLALAREHGLDAELHVANPKAARLATALKAPWRWGEWREERF